MSNKLFIVYNFSTAAIWFIVILLLNLTPNLDFSGNAVDWTIRMLGTAFMYGFLFLLIVRAILSSVKLQVERLQYWRSAREKSEDAEFSYLIELFIFITAILLTLILAITDEYLQSAIPGRISSLPDILVNLIAILIAAIVTVRFPLLSEFEARAFKGLKKR